MGEDPFMLSITKVQRESHLNEGSVDMSYLMCILSLLCNVATLGLNVATIQRRDVSTSRCQF